VYNNRWASTNTEINSTTIGSLVQNCYISYENGVSATPVVLDNVVYYPTSNGSFYALNIGTCDYIWSVNVSEIITNYAPLTPLQIKNSLLISRSSPQIDGDVLYFGTQAGALLVAVDLYTGAFLGNIQVSPHPLAILTMSPTVYNHQIYIGASSQEESASLDPTYPCCDFIGIFAAYTFDRAAGKFTESWNVTTLPANEGWSGATVWGSQPAIDPLRNQVFIGTGNIYTYPPSFESCLNQTASCLPDDVWQESVIAIDIPTGKVNWRKSISPLDGWVMVCGYAGANVSSSPLCPERPGPDADFGMAPTFVPAALGDGTTGVDSVVIGEKNGNLISFNAITGDIQWNILTSPDSNVGGLSWGIAIDDSQVYFTGINYGAKSWPLTNGPTINNSAWGAANLKTGQLLWETPDPNDAMAFSPPGVVNDIVLVANGGSQTTKVNGTIIALDKKTGTILKQWPVDSVQHSGISVQGGFMFFGSGYHYDNAFNMGSFYVWGLPDAIAAAKLVPVTTRDPTTAPTVSATSAAPATTTTKKGAAIKTGRMSDAAALCLVLVLGVAVMV
jgi:outer membrane protein assembly factor BamB